MSGALDGADHPAYSPTRPNKNPRVGPGGVQRRPVLTLAQSARLAADYPDSQSGEAGETPAAWFSITLAAGRLTAGLPRYIGETWGQHPSGGVTARGLRCGEIVGDRGQGGNTLLSISSAVAYRQLLCGGPGKAIPRPS